MPTEYDNFRQMRYDKIFFIGKEKVAYMEKMDKVLEEVLEYLKHKRGNYGIGERHPFNSANLSNKTI